MHEFGHKMSKLYFDGTLIDLKGNYGKQTVKFGVFLGSVDLPAECKILNMIQFNGSSGCSTCEEPSECVKQGKCTTQHYPYHPAMDRAVIPQTRNMKQDARRATNDHRIKGIIGHFGLASMPWFDYVLGIVPDYMHGCLLGAAKTLMYLWFSPTNSKKTYFTGDKFRKISQMLQSMKPLDYIEWLPCDIETLSTLKSI